uniref:Nuclear receptor domain-containing protein n=1 Tax=Panagrolaimus sp. JU765 TaxID=591449 RepID=A0AC34R294_9BILA
MSKNCLICGGISSGIYFGVQSCKACSSFFRRSVAEGKTYFCPRNGDCEITADSRRSCRACRMRRCFDRGMVPVSAVEDCPENVPSSSPVLTVQKSDVLKTLENGFKNFVNAQKGLFKLQNSDTNILGSEDDFKPNTPEIHNKLEIGSASMIFTLFFSICPGFAALTTEDIRKVFGPFAVRFLSLYRIWLTATFFEDGDDRIAFHYGYFSCNDIIKSFFGNVSNIQDIEKYLEPLHSSYSRVAKKLRRLKIEIFEISALMGLIFYHQLEKFGLSVPETVKDEVSTTLFEKIAQNRGTNESLRFSKILQLLVDVEDVVSVVDQSFVISKFVPNGDVILLNNDSDLIGNET